MKAARYYGPKDIRVEEIDKPVPTSKQVLIKVLELSSNYYTIDLSVLGCLVSGPSPRCPYHPS